MKESGSEKKENNTAQKWEYKFVNNGLALNNVEKVDNAMNALGAEGWEAFAATDYRIFYRRPVGN